MSGWVTWSPELVEQLRALAAAKYSTAQAAYELGVSRNAAIGAAHRNKITFGAVVPTDRPRAPRTATPTRRRGGLKLSRIKPPTLPVAAPPVASEPPGRHRCSLLDLASSSCRWPVTAEPPHLFCGEPEADFPAQPYCRYHTRLSRNSRDALSGGTTAAAGHDTAHRGDSTQSASPGP